MYVNIGHPFALDWLHYDSELSTVLTVITNEDFFVLSSAALLNLSVVSYC